MPPAPPAQLIRAHLERIERSAAFARADRLRAFLRYVVERTLDDEAHTLKEYSIALAVCGRPPSFDARADPIVRVDATRLRARLEAYYSLEGRDEVIRILLPKGSYVPTFRSVPPADAAVPPASLVVLPFVGVGAPQDGEAFTDGLTEELIHQLSRIPEVRVIAPTSAFHYRGRSADLPRIAAELGVDHAVEGSVRWAGERIRVTVQLTEVAARCVRWSEQYDRHLTDAFAVQDDICASVAHALKIQLAETPRPVAAVVDARAHVEYLKGRYFWNRRTAASLSQSLAYYRRALAIDPSFAPAHCGIADTVLVQALNEQIDSISAQAEAGSHAREATRLAPHLAEVHTSAAAVASVLEWDWDRGEGLFQRASELNPGFPLAHYLYAMFNLAPQARWDEALIAMDRALELDPVSPVLTRDLGIVHYLRGEYREAEDALHDAEVLDPGFRGSLFWRGRTYAEQGRLDEALATFEARQHEPGANSRVLASVVHTLGAMGRHQEAAERFEGLRASPGGERVPPLNLAIALIGLRREDAAIDQLERALAEHAVPLYQLAVDPVYAPLRPSPRFAAILRRMRMPGVRNRSITPA